MPASGSQRSQIDGVGIVYLPMHVVVWWGWPG